MEFFFCVATLYISLQVILVQSMDSSGVTLVLSTLHTDYSGEGVDQLAQVIHTIKTNPNDRRIIMSACNPVGKGSSYVIGHHM